MEKSILIENQDFSNYDAMYIQKSRIREFVSMEKSIIIIENQAILIDFWTESCAWAQFLYSAMGLDFAIGLSQFSVLS